MNHAPAMAREQPYEPHLAAILIPSSLTAAARSVSVS